MGTRDRRTQKFMFYVPIFSPYLIKLRTRLDTHLVWFPSSSLASTLGRGGASPPASPSPRPPLPPPQGWGRGWPVRDCQPGWDWRPDSAVPDWRLCWAVLDSGRGWRRRWWRPFDGWCDGAVGGGDPHHPFRRRSPEPEHWWGGAAAHPRQVVGLAGGPPAAAGGLSRPRPRPAPGPGCQTSGASPTRGWEFDNQPILPYFFYIFTKSIFNNLSMIILLFSISCYRYIF